MEKYAEENIMNRFAPYHGLGRSSILVGYASCSARGIASLSYFSSKSSPFSLQSRTQRHPSRCTCFTTSLTITSLQGQSLYL